jgi:hypothetical protein
MRIITLVAVAGFAVGCAAHDRATEPVRATSANTAAVMASGATAAPVATGTVTPATSSGDPADTVDQSIVKRGYRARRVNGQLMYCRSETQTGTHFSNTVCLTAAQIKAIELNAQSTLDTMSQIGRSACVSKTNCN